MGATFTTDNRPDEQYKNCFYAYLDGVVVLLKRFKTPQGFTNTMVKCSYKTLKNIKIFLKKKDFVFYTKVPNMEACTVDGINYNSLGEVRAKFPNATTCKEITNGFIIPYHITMDFCTTLLNTPAASAPAVIEETPASAPDVIEETPASAPVLDHEETSAFATDVIEETLASAREETSASAPDVIEETLLSTPVLDHDETSALAPEVNALDKITVSVPSVPSAIVKVDRVHTIFIPDGNGGLGIITIKGRSYGIHLAPYLVKNGSILCACVSINDILCQVVY